MKLTTLTAKAAFAIECVPDNTKRFIAEVNQTRDQLRAARCAKLGLPLPATVTLNDALVTKP